MNKDKNQKKINKIIETLSIPENEFVSETIHNPIQKKSTFCLYKDGKFNEVDSIQINEISYKPIDGRNALLENKVILLPESLGDFNNCEELFESVRSLIHRHVSVSEEFEILATHYVLLSWVYDHFNAIPYLRVLGDAGSGKTRFLQVLGSLCYRGTFFGGSSTPSAIMRMTDQIRGTGVIDEANFGQSDMTAYITQILNQGYSSGFSIIKTDGTNGIFNPKSFNVYGPKIIASRERFSDQALESRCLTETMLPMKNLGNIPSSLTKEFEEESSNLRNQLLRYRFTFTKESFNEEVDQEIHPRVRQIYSPLLAVSPNAKTRELVKESINNHHQNLLNIIRDSDEFNVFTRLLVCYEKTNEPTVKQISSALTSEITEKRVGYLLRKKLFLKTLRKMNGYVVPHALNKESIENNKKSLVYQTNRRR